VTLYLVPCGVSIRDGLANRAGIPPDAAADALYATSLAWAAQVRATPEAAVTESWWNTVDRVLDDALLRDWNPQVSAETSTLASRYAALSDLLDDGHTVVVLASDTDHGLASAMLVATYLTPQPDQLRYCVTPTDTGRGRWTCQFPEGTVTVARIIGLDPRRPAGLRDATAGIGRILRAAYDNSTRIEVHLTGGLKSTLLHTMTMTEILGSLPQAQVTAWYLFNDDPDKVQPVSIDLRKFAEEDLIVLGDELRRVRDGRPTGGRVFVGTGWIERDGRRELTAFGTGFLAVLGESPIRRSDDGQPA
jgi:hypothetical protein